jgi:hypothetical protein
MFPAIRQRTVSIIALAALCSIGVKGLAAAQPVAAPIDFDDSVSLFNGKDLTGWEGETQLWSARDGMIVGKSPGIKYNTFLATTKEYQDFELKLSFRLVGGAGNSGVQIRSARRPNSPQVVGYQADIGEKHWGSLYDEARRDKFLLDARQDGTTKEDGWNDYVIRCQGDHFELTLNGVKTVDYHEADASIPRSGIIALQVHAGAPMEIQFKDIRIRKLGK